MKDPARSKPVARTLHLPPAGRPRWVCPPSAELDLAYLGWGRRRFGLNPVPQSRHPGWVYFFICAGKPLLSMQSRVLQTRPGQLLLVGPDCASGWSDAPGGVCDVMTWVWRTAPRCAECTPQPNGWLTFAADAKLRRILLNDHALCRREVEQPDSHTKLALEQIRLQMDLAIARAQQPRAVAPEPALRMELALRWMAANPAASNPVSSLCEYLQISPATLYRLFQTHLGASPADHHAHERMEHARHMLTASRASVKATAYALGYKHPNDFSRAFKKHAGRTPKTLMKS